MPCGAVAALSSGGDGSVPTMGSAAPAPPVAPPPAISVKIRAMHREGIVIAPVLYRSRGIVRL